MPSIRDVDGVLDPALLRLVLITDGRGDFERIRRIVQAATSAGVRCVQLREPLWNARLLAEACEPLRPLLDAVGGLLLVNDRVDLAAAGIAHGVQIGHRSMPAEFARGVLGEVGVLSYSAHDDTELELAAASGCDCALLSPVWPTTSKPGTPPLGVTRAAKSTARAGLPVIWLGGIDVEHAAVLTELHPRSRPVGVAVRSAICGADDPFAAAAALLRVLEGAKA